MGDIRIEAEPSSNANEVRTDFTVDLPLSNWVIHGKLRAETPFFFGTESSDEQSSFSVILDSKGYYRLPRSVIRGVARRDLNEILEGAGCEATLRN